jgi:hypothetical protein
MSQKIAHIPLDFTVTKSVCGAKEKRRHGCENLGNCDQAHLKEMSGRLNKAAGIAKSAEVCAEAGNLPKALAAVTPRAASSPDGGSHEVQQECEE